MSKEESPYSPAEQYVVHCLRLQNPQTTMIVGILPSKSPISQY